MSLEAKYVEGSGEIELNFPAVSLVEIGGRGDQLQAIKDIVLKGFQQDLWRRRFRECCLGRGHAFVELTAIAFTSLGAVNLSVLLEMTAVKRGLIVAVN